MNKIVFFDVDGTLYNSEKHLPSSTKEALFLARRNGYEIAIATGRAPFMIKSLLEELEIDTYVTFNGQYVVYKGQVIFTDSIPNDYLQQIIDFGERRDEPIIAMVIEQMEGEAFYGVQYREVLDLNGIVTQNDIPVCLYFYTTLSNDCSSVTAWVEDMAQAYDGKVLFVSVNAMECQDIVSAYQIEYLPEFVLISNGARISTFEGYNYEAWTASDVMYWLSENGIN